MSSHSIIVDLKYDCGNLISEFNSLDTTSYTAFLKLWKEHNFDLIYAGQGESDIDYFIFHVIHVAKGFTNPANAKFQQIGGLYLLYLLYYTQPLKVKKAIRLIPDEFIHLKSLAEEYKYENKEVAYAFYKLLLDNAFDYTVTPLPYDENLIHHKDDLKNMGTKSFSAEEGRKADVLHMVLKDTGFNKDEWTRLVREYNNIKKKINNCSSLNLSLTKSMDE